MSKKVVVIGASPNASRFSNRAVKKLLQQNYVVYAVGKAAGEIDNIPIVDSMPDIHDVYAVVLYINPQIQKKYYNAIVNLKPDFVFFNPDTYNPEFVTVLKNNHIKVTEGCALASLSLGDF